MKKILIGSLFFLLCLNASDIPDFNHLENTKNAVFLLSTPKSGTNVISGSLSVITRKPISWLYWKRTILDPTSKWREHPSYNRLNLDLVTDIPLLYRTHYEFDELLQIDSERNKLIFVTRNPKELLYRRFLLENEPTAQPTAEFIEEFLKEYLNAWYVFHAWHPKNRVLVYYEDFIVNDEAILVNLLNFIDEPPLYLDDFLTHKQDYMHRLLDSYKKQHTHNSGGSSSINGPKPIHYSKNADSSVLQFIDHYLKTTAPHIWELYLKRFQCE